MFVKISNSSIKRCRENFPYKGIGKVINSAIQLFNKVSVEIVISEFIYDSDDSELYNVLLYLIRENCTDEKIIDELSSFDYKNV